MSVLMRILLLLAGPFAERLVNTSGPAPALATWFGCPSRSHIRPCICQERPKGLDISCESGRVADLRDSLAYLSQLGQVLSFLKLRYVPMESLEPYVLHSVDVRHLTVSYGNLSAVDEMTFVGHGDRLESLELSHNSLTQVPSKSLHPLRMLVSLNLSYNRLEILHAAAFKGLISLLRLSLYGNKIKFIDDLAFVGIGGNLTKMNLGSNQLSSVPSQALRNLTVLQTLQLQENRIFALLPEEFRGLESNLDVLNLANNLLQELPARTFGSLKALSTLDLEGNLIYSIDWGVFHGVEGSLEWLRLGYNLLTTVPSVALRNLTKLRQLDLRANNITQVPEDAFHPFGANIKFLYLQKNWIQNLEPGSLDSLHAVEWLYLNSNKLSSIHYETVMSVLDTLKVLDVHGNPFHCDCRLSWFRDWVAEQRTTVVNMPKETRCASPTALVKVPISDVTGSEILCTSSSPHRPFPFPPFGLSLALIGLTAMS